MAQAGARYHRGAAKVNLPMGTTAARCWTCANDCTTVGVAEDGRVLIEASGWLWPDRLKLPFA